MKRTTVYGLTCVLMLLAMTAGATTIVVPTDEQLLAKTPVVVDGTVLSTTAVESDGRIWTATLITVARVLKGDAENTITVREIGGEVDGRITKMFGTPEFVPGERVLLFLEPAPRGGYRTIDLFVGKFAEAKMMNGRPLWLRDTLDDVTLLDADLQPIHAKNIQRDAAGFEQFLLDRLAGRPGVKNYGIENPVLARDEAPSGRIRANFTLISEPTVYRWFRFDTGGSAAWVSNGTQPGYTGGGVSELQTAMSSWNNYSAATINYSYTGAVSGTPGGLDRANGSNEVLFSDPLNEISGTWNRSTGGVVGIGGFNGVTSGGNWAAPFAADPTHPAGTIRAYNITEGNLTIQDGVSSANGIGSSRLAEIISHEFGHTLGFGHSADSGALMYNTVLGLGPQLRADDELAARWLYPSGSSTPPPPPPQVPAAPSNLAANSSGSTINLSWSDNANNETSQAVFLASGQGAFSNVGEVSANVTGATISGVSNGTYRLYVVATNATGSSPGSNTVNVTVGSTLAARFTFSPSNPTTNDTVVFTDDSTGGVSSWFWTFGDGSNSQSQNPTRRYTSPGTYTVTLTVTRNTATSTVSNSVTVSSAAPATPPVEAAFDVGPATVIAGSTATFTDRSTGSPTSWSWSFGDGTTSSSQNPLHAYAAPGLYTVTLTASNGETSSSATRQLTVISTAAYRSLIPVTAQTRGVGGTSWRTELSLFNAGAQSADVTLIFIPGAGGSIITRSAFLSPKQSATYANTLLDLFGLAEGAGALAIEATSAGATAQLRVTSRTFTGGGSGTYGQAVPDVQSDDFETTLYLTGLQANDAFRTNVGLVNRGSSPMPATLTLHDEDGGTVGTTNVTVPASNFQQSPLATYFPEVAGRSFGVLSMRITAASQDSLSGYVSVIDNATQDPIYIQAMPPPSGNVMTIPVVGRAPGVNGTFWRSDVTLYNPGSPRMTLSVRYGSSTNTLSLGGRETFVLADVLSTFDQSSGSGPLSITWNGSNGPVVTSRTYTSVETGGTFGQSIDPIAAFAPEVFVAGLRSDGSYRSNVGFVNGGTEAETFQVTLLSPSGTALGSTNVTLAAQAQTQTSVAALFPNVSSSVGSFTLSVRGDGNANLFAYGSMVDNGSGDPVFFAGR